MRAAPHAGAPPSAHARPADELVEDIVKAGAVEAVVPLLVLADRRGPSGQTLPAGRQAARQQRPAPSPLAPPPSHNAAMARTPRILPA